jgi:hypothetical protein
MEDVENPIGKGRSAPEPPPETEEKRKNEPMQIEEPPEK